MRFKSYILLLPRNSSANVSHRKSIPHTHSNGPMSKLLWHHLDSVIWRKKINDFCIRSNSSYKIVLIKYDQQFN